MMKIKNLKTSEKVGTISATVVLAATLTGIPMVAYADDVVEDDSTIFINGYREFHSSNGKTFTFSLDENIDKSKQKNCLLFLYYNK